MILSPKDYILTWISNRGGEEVMVDCGGTDATGPFEVSKYKIP